MTIMLIKAKKKNRDLIGLKNKKRNTHCSGLNVSSGDSGSCNCSFSSKFKKESASSAEDE